MSQPLPVRHSILLVPALMLLLLLGISAGPGVAGAAHYDRNCGSASSDGGYSYTRVANMSCRHGKKVANKAWRKFCKRHHHCRIRDFEQMYRGKVRRNGWKCKITVAIELFRGKCDKGNMRVIRVSGA